MNEDRAGAASGINNAVARVAGVLAIAVFGIVMVRAFGFRLDHNVAQLQLPDEVVRQIHAGETKLAGLPVPAGLDDGGKAALTGAIGNAFVYGYRIVMLLCAVLGLASALAARLIIPRNIGGEPAKQKW